MEWAIPHLLLSYYCLLVLLSSRPPSALKQDHAGKIQEPKGECAQHHPRHKLVYAHLMHIAHLQEIRQRAFPRRRIGVIPRQTRRIAVVPRNDAGEIAHSVRNRLSDKIHPAIQSIRAWQCIPAGPRNHRHARRHRHESAHGQPPAAIPERKRNERKRKERRAFARKLKEK